MTSRFVEVQERIPFGSPLTYARMDLNLSHLQMQMPIGAYLDYPVNDDIPATFLECNGTSFTIPTQESDPYYELYQVIGITHNTGDTPAGEFSIPDTRGYFTRHVGGVDTEPARAPGSTQLHAFASHTHRTGPYWNQTGNNIAAYPWYTANYTAFSPHYTYSDATGTGTETRPSNIGVIRLIKFASEIPTG